ncbi:MAG: pyrroline-5-carboxylate reductase [Ruminococcaceae bacterium]|nr:pyrroline-5-carboxylate reductase [Oscillospiraceae bacterium]
MNKTFSVIGVGNISRAFLSALSTLSGKFEVKNDTVTLYNRTPEKIADLKKVGYNVTEDILTAAESGDILFIGVKPQNLSEIFGSLRARGADLSAKTIVSPCAGVSCEDLEKLTGSKTIVRIMPNTPMQIGKGVTEICRSGSVGDKDFQYICRVFSMCGEVVTVTEAEMNAMTAATSSAVALVYRLIGAFCNGARECGATSPQLENAVAKAFIGASEMLMTSPKSADELVAAVRSPKGATEQALRVFDEKNMDGIIAEALRACAERCEELGKECMK